MSETSVLVVDDDEDMRSLVRAIIEVENDGLSVAGEAPDGATAIAMCHERDPGVVLLDHQMPEMTGLEAAERILLANPDQAIVLFSAYLDQQITTTAARIGVRTCLSKRDVNLLPQTLRALGQEAEGPAT